MSAKPTNYKAGTDAKIDEAIKDVDAKTPTVPAQAKQLEDVQIDAVSALEESLRVVEKNMKHVYGMGVDVRIKRDDNGDYMVEVVDPDESKAKRLVAGAKGLFNRNKKLVLTTAGLLATTAVLKVIAARQEIVLEADEVVVESSDQIPVDA